MFVARCVLLLVVRFFLCVWCFVLLVLLLFVVAVIVVIKLVDVDVVHCLLFVVNCVVLCVVRC